MAGLLCAALTALIPCGALCYHVRVTSRFISSIRRRSTDGLDEADAALIDFGRELFGNHRVTPQTYARIAVLFERRMLVDLVNLMGMYAATAALLIAFDAQLPAGAAPGLPPR